MLKIRARMLAAAVGSHVAVCACWWGSACAETGQILHLCVIRLLGALWMNI